MTVEIEDILIGPGEVYRENHLKMFGMYNLNLNWSCPWVMWDQINKMVFLEYKKKN